MEPVVASAVLFGMAKAYTTTQGVDVPFTTQLAISSLLGASAYATSMSEIDNPAMRALTTGSLFAGIMYFGFNTRRPLLYATLGTVASYTAEIITAKNPPAEEQEDGDY
jgi:hypothetical protein